MSKLSVMKLIIDRIYGFFPDDRDFKGEGSGTYEMHTNTARFNYDSPETIQSKLEDAVSKSDHPLAPSLIRVEDLSYMSNKSYEFSKEEDGNTPQSVPIVITIH